MDNRPEIPVLSRGTLPHIASWLDAAAELGAVAFIDKEETWTSFDVVAKLRGATRIRRVGHAGTLDPLATGLLIVCFGRATKTIESYQEAEKEYHVVVKLGATTATDDRGADEQDQRSVDHLTTEAVLEALQTFEGTIEQIPPAFAAIKHDGKRQYDLAREGRPFTERTRTVTVLAITDISVDLPFVSCTIRCSKGTYIRSIARDLGRVLGCGGYVHALRRTAIGPYRVDDAVTVAEVVTAITDVKAAA